MHRTFGSLGLMLVGCALAPATPARAGTCPPTTVQVGSFSTADYYIAALDTTRSGGFYPGVFNLSYDLVSGALHVDKDINSSTGAVAVNARDAYDVAGLPGGTVVPLTAMLDVNGYMESPGCGGTGCYGVCGAAIVQGAAQVVREVSVGFSGRSDLITTLELPISVTVGTPLVVEFDLYERANAGGDWHGGVADAQIRFTGLPAGASIVSCYGYSGGATPAHSLSWGRLKTIYR